MEINTLIQWNCISYGLYYSLNFAWDYYRNREVKDQTSVTYNIKELLNEAPETIKASDFSDAALEIPLQPSTNITEIQSEPITFKGGIEGQGIPMHEFLVNSKQFSSAVY
jgi:hypothetical protein